MVFDRLKRVFSGSSSGDAMGEDYVEIDLGREEKENKVMVKVFMLRQYEDVNKILNALREGYTIAIVDFKVLKQKDPIELKRAVSKIKKTVDALEGSIAGHDNIVIVTPSFAKIYKEVEPDKNEPRSKFDD